MRSSARIDTTRSNAEHATVRPKCEKKGAMSFSRVFTRSRAAPVFLILCLLAIALTLYMTAPGYMSTDSGDQLEQARSMRLRDDNPVLMALIWHYADRIVEGPLGMLVLSTVVYWSGLTVLFWSAQGPLVARAVALLAVGFYPPTFVNVPVVWKDTLMQAALIAAVACLAVPTARFRVARYLAALLFVVVALGVRHNAATAVWPLFIVPLSALSALARRPRWLRFVVASLAGLALTLGLTLGVDRTFSPLARRTEFWQLIPVFDLAGMSVQTGAVLVDPESGVLTPGMGLNEIRRFYQPAYVNRLYYCMPLGGRRCVPLFRQTTDRERLAALSNNWRRAILQHPMAYVAHRFEVAKPLLGIENGAPGHFYVRGAPHHRMAKPYPPRPRTVRLFEWLDSQFGSAWFLPWVYVLFGCLLLPVAFIRYARGRSAFPLIFLLSGLSYMFGLFIVTGSAPYRYTVWTSLCVVVALALLILPAVEGVWDRWSRRVRPSAPAEPAQ
jgi:hypothetical protein